MPTPIESAAQTVATGLAVWEAWGASVDQFNAWMMGTVTGGPNGDGYYPMTDRAGVTHMFPCPALSAAASTIRYAYNPALPTQSIAHQPFVVGQAMNCVYYDSSNQAGSSSIWLPLDQIGTAAPGSVTYITTPIKGLVMTGDGTSGSRPRFLLIVPAGNVLDIRAAGIKCDGVLNSSRAVVSGTTGQQATLYAIRDAAIANGWRLTGAGMILCEVTMDMLNARLHMPDLIWKATTAIVAGQDILQSGFKFGGTTRSTDIFDIDVHVQGLNTFNHSPRSYENGVLLYDVSSAMGKAKIKATYCGRSHTITGNFEKAEVEVTGIYCADHLKMLPVGPDTILTAAASPGDTIISVANQVRMTKDLALLFENNTSNQETAAIAAVLSDNQVQLKTPLTLNHAIGSSVGNPGAFSPDTVKASISAQSYIGLYRETENGDTSIWLHLNTEARDDPGTSEPCIFIGNGKKTILSGQVRSFNGAKFLQAYNRTNNGANTLKFNFLSMIHGYGTAFDFQNIHRVGGRLEIKDYGATGTTYQRGPTVKIGSVWELGGLFLDMTNITSDVGVQVGGVYDETEFGGSTTVTRMPINTTLRLSLEMGAADPFTAVNPNNYTGLDWQYSNGFTIDARAGFKGKINIAAGVKRGELFLPSTWVSSGATIAVATAAEVVIDLGHVYSYEIFGWLQARKGMKAYVLDYRCYMSFDGTRWIPEKPLIVSALAIAALAADPNAYMAYTGLQANLTDTGLPRFKTGPNPNSSWTDAVGGSANTVAYQSETDALVTRLSTAGFTALNTAHLNAYDRLYFDLKDAGILSKTILLYALATANRNTAYLNLKTGLIGGSYNLAESGGQLAFAADHGLTGSGIIGGAYLTTGFDPGVVSEGMVATDISASAFVLTGAASNGPDVAALNAKLKVKARRTTSAQISMGTQTVVGSAGGTTEAPRWVGGTVDLTNTANQLLYDNGNFFASGTRSGTGIGLPDAIVLLKDLSGTTTASNRQLAFAHVGLALTDSQMASMYRAQWRFLRAVGAM